MELVTRIGPKNQVVIPLEIRKQKGIRPGDSLMWEIREDTGEITVLVRPNNFSSHMRGLGKEVWRGIDVKEYVKEQRKSWN